MTELTVVTDNTDDGELDPSTYYIEAQYKDSSRLVITAVRADMAVEEIAVDPRDPRYNLIVNGDANRGIERLEIGSQVLEQLKVAAYQEVEELFEMAENHPLWFNNWEWLVSGDNRSTLSNLVITASTQQSIGQKWATTLPFADGVARQVISSELIGFWNALVNRSADIMRQKAVFRGKVLQAGSEEALERVLAELEAAIDTLTRPGG